MEQFVFVIRKVITCGPVALESKVGWILSGSLQATNAKTQHSILTLFWWKQEKLILSKTNYIKGFITSKMLYSAEEIFAVEGFLINFAELFFAIQENEPNFAELT